MSGKFILTLVLGALFTLASGWALMLAVGVARAEWIHTLPTIGFGPAVLLAALLRLAFQLSGSI